MRNFPRISQVVAFRGDGLPPGRHTIRIVSKSGAYAVLDAFRIMQERRQPGLFINV
jgi:hypothetical protein